MALRQSQRRWSPPQRTRKDLPFPVFTPWRWRTNIKLHYRTLDLEGPYEPDDFFKAEVTAGAFYDFISPSEARRKKYQQRARAKAERIVAEAHRYVWLAAARKRLQRVEREFEFVWEPYRRALEDKHGWQWQIVTAANREYLYAVVWREMARLAWISKQPERDAGRVAREESARKREERKRRRERDLQELRERELVECGTVETIKTAVTQLGKEYGVQWQSLARDGKPYLKLFFPEDTVLEFVREPHGRVGQRLDRIGFDWKVHLVGAKHWLGVIFPIPELLNWLRQGTPKL